MFAVDFMSEYLLTRYFCPWNSIFFIYYNMVTDAQSDCMLGSFSRSFVVC